MRTKLYDFTFSFDNGSTAHILSVRSDGFTIIDVALKRYQTYIVLDITVCRDIILWIKEMKDRKRKRYIYIYSCEIYFFVQSRVSLRSRSRFPNINDT